MHTFARRSGQLVTNVTTGGAMFARRSAIDKIVPKPQTGFDRRERRWCQRVNRARRANLPIWGGCKKKGRDRAQPFKLKADPEVWTPKGLRTDRRTRVRRRGLHCCFTTSGLNKWLSRPLAAERPSLLPAIPHARNQPTAIRRPLVGAGVDVSGFTRRTS